MLGLLRVCLSAGTGLRTSLLLGCIHLLSRVVELGDSSIDGSYVLCLVGSLQLLYGCLYLCLYVSRKLVATLLQHVLGLEDH